MVKNRERELIVGSSGRCGSVLLEYGFREIRKLRDLTSHVFCIRRRHRISSRYTETSNIICTTRRDLREIISSTKRYIGKPYCEGHGRTNIAQECEKQLKYYYQWKGYSTSEFLYEDFIINKEKYIRQMFNAVRMEPTSKELKYMMEFTNKPLKEKHHITNKKRKLITFRDTLTERELQEIYDFVKSNNIDKDKFLYIEQFYNAL